MGENSSAVAKPDLQANEADLEALFLALEVRKTVRGVNFLRSFQASVLAPQGSCHS